MADRADPPEAHTSRLVTREAPRLVSIALSVVAGPDRGARTDVVRRAVRIGSSAGADLVLGDKTVSRLHCQLSVRPRGFALKDLSSTNGTFAGGLRLESAEVPPGTILHLGDSAVRVDTGDDDVFDEVSGADAFGDLLGSSLAMRRVYALLERIAPSEATLLVLGETGSGKEVLARSVHGASTRARGPFVAVDCGAIPETLFESELFGHVRGAFTGAISDRVGAFEEASGGTLFLDEIGELPMASQAKLLRAIETKTIRRVGAPGSRAVDVRILAATNRSLERAVNGGTFREDLFYRLAQVEVRLPPLRERREDIPRLAEHFYKSSNRTSAPREPLPAHFAYSLLGRSFPGNVRELKNHVERAALLGVLGRDRARASSLPPPPSSISSSATPSTSIRALPFAEARDACLEDFELRYVRDVLSRAKGNVTHAAELAGTNRRYIQRVVARLGVDPRSLSGVMVSPGEDDET